MPEPVERLIRGVPFFHSLDRVDVARLTGALEEVTFSAGEVVFAEGDDADALYLLEAGRIAVSIWTPSGEQPLAEEDGPAHFGELGLLLVRRTGFGARGDRPPCMETVPGTVQPGGAGAARPRVRDGRGARGAPRLPIRLDVPRAAPTPLRRTLSVLAAVGVPAVSLDDGAAGRADRRGLACRPHHPRRGACVARGGDARFRHRPGHGDRVGPHRARAGGAGAGRLHEPVLHRRAERLGPCRRDGASGLLYRIALRLLRTFPPSYPGQALALLVGGLLITPLMPLSIARAAAAAPAAQEPSQSLGFACPPFAPSGAYTGSTERGGGRAIVSRTQDRQPAQRSTADTAAGPCGAPPRIDGEDRRSRLNVFEGLRRRVFMAALLLGAVSALFESAFAVRGSFEQTGGLLFSISLAALLATTARSRALSMGSRVGAVLIVGVYIAAKVWNVLFAYSDTSVFPAMVSRMAPWGPVDLFMAWILFDNGRALYATVAVYYAALLAPIAAFGAVRGVAAMGNVLGVTGPLVLASVVTTVLLTALVRLRDEYARVRVSHDTVLRLAQTDALTGLPNRRFLEEELVREIAGASRSHEALSLVLVDLDHFKRINDEDGHGAGDDALIAIAHRLRAALRAGDRIGRLGGEEFLVVAPGTRADEARALAERLQRVIAGPPLGEKRRVVTASLGVAAYCAGDTPATLLRRADTALYRAKRLGRNRVEGPLPVARGEPGKVRSPRPDSNR